MGNTRAIKEIAFFVSREVVGPGVYPGRFLLSEPMFCSQKTELVLHTHVMCTYHPPVYT